MNAPVSFAKDRVRILLLEGIHPSAVDTFRAAGYNNVELLPTALNEDDLIEKIKGVHFLGIRSRTQLTRKVFEAADRLLAAGCFCIGTNQVDLQAAKENAVAVFNAPYSNTRSVAELVLAEAILLLRGIPEKNAVAHRGGWLKSAKNSFEVRGKTLGIVGYGSIGSQLSVLAESLGMRVIFHDAVSKLPLGNASQVPSLDALLEKADVVSLHVPELDSTKDMIGERELGLMKPESVLINASRGTVVDIDALATALSNGRARRLEALDLWGNGIGPRGGKALAAALHSNRALRTLELRDNGVRPLNPESHVVSSVGGGCLLAFSRLSHGAQHLATRQPRPSRTPWWPGCVRTEAPSPSGAASPGSGPTAATPAVSAWSETASSST